MSMNLIPVSEIPWEDLKVGNSIISNNKVFGTISELIHDPFAGTYEVRTKWPHTTIESKLRHDQLNKVFLVLN